MMEVEWLSAGRLLVRSLAPHEAADAPDVVSSVNGCVRMC